MQLFRNLRDRDQHKASLLSGSNDNHVYDDDD